MGKPPTLRRRMIVSLGLMVLGSLAIGIGSIIAIEGLHQDLGLTVRGYRQLRQLFDVGFLSSKAREAISANPPQPQPAADALRAALTTLNDRSETVDGAPRQWTSESDRAVCERLLKQSIDELEQGSPNPTSLNLLFARLSKISDEVRQSIVDAQVAADRKRLITLITIVAICGLVVTAAIVNGVRHYRRVMGPVRQITEGVRAFAGGTFERRINPQGDQEFLSLADNFNHMADELATLYRDLEQQVQIKTSELIRSERLASVGYLAAGVAHEINNPLGIIAGYSERALQQLASHELSDSTLPRTRQALNIICEEVFRCKTIIDRLLSLARPGTEHREVVSIAFIAETVVSTLSGLGSIGGRSLTLKPQIDADLSALVNEGEIKQVILNLIINAIESTDPLSGKIDLEIKRDGPVIEVLCFDNGCGMTVSTLDQIFQPFFTQKRGLRPGTGLGLSIAHTIVTNHGGSISAGSQGLGAGSTFTIHLPAVVKEATLARV